MKIVFFSDVHGNVYPMSNMLKELSTRSVDSIIFGGDIFGYYYQQNKIINLLRENNIVSLLGNHDQMFLDILDNKCDRHHLVDRYGKTYLDIENRISSDNIGYVKQMKTRLLIKVDSLKLLFVHGSVDDNINGRVYPDTNISDYSVYAGLDYVFMGHTHHKMIKKIANGTVLVNPGSIGQQRDGAGCTYLIFDSSTREVEFHKVEYDKQILIEEIKLHHESTVMEAKLLEVLDRKK